MVNNIFLVYSLNQPLWNILSSLGLENKKIFILSQTIKNYFDDKTFNKNDTLKIKILSDSSIILTIKKNFNKLEILLKDTIREVHFQKGFIQKKLEIIKGSIEGNLYNSILKLNELPELVEKYADIFAWDIDFLVETEDSDSFLIVLEKLYYNERLIGYGDIYYAVYYGKKVGIKKAIKFGDKYYDENGNTLSRMFLKSPLKIYKITSYMGYRFHPILREYRLHHGVDYAAPYGTPVFSLGDGVVIYAGWKGGYGNIVIIKHPKGYETRYAHLSKISVFVNQRVSAGQYIGNVGSTGLSTGPHLHFEMRKDGKLINPLKLKIQPEKPIDPEKLDEFTKTKNLIIHFIKLNTI
ncbi:MAG: peptidoglycan DD-metalloendopeptidase family protein [candidate division WOR-3 bacterium]